MELLIVFGITAIYLVYVYREDIEVDLRLSRTRKNVNELIRKIFKSKKVIFAIAALEIGAFLVIIYLGLTAKVFFAAVLSNSMYPTFERGDIVLIQTIFKDPKKGDIIMFTNKESGYPITHRVLRVVGDKVYTGGDASGPDGDPISKKDIIGKAILIFGKPIVVKGVGNYFILDAKELRNITPYGEEYLFYKKLLDAFRQYAIAVIVIGVSGYIYLTIREMK